MTREEHVHVYIATKLREEEVPRNPSYRKGDKVFVCALCGRLNYANPWIDKDARYRAVGDTF